MVHDKIKVPHGTDNATGESDGPQAAFEAACGENETVARGGTAEDYRFVASAYGTRCPARCRSRHAVFVNGVRPSRAGARTRCARKRLRPGRRVPAGAEPAGPVGRLRQLRDASASFHVADGRMTSAALAGSGW
ncbi:hypothetical protein SUDANB176_06574 [Streptomyces sp. enrichment culture]